MKKLLPYEVWRDINGFEGLYQIGARGNVKSLRRKWATGAKGTIIASHKDIIMKPPVLKNGYLNIILSKNGNKYGRTIHRLVAMAFINNPNHKKTG